ncbi:MAG TPA: hypothetical protein VKI45_09435, partial [Allosphingosinicella sp.]|nr:hypothetical protein [Allosphingosinicella sp.]
IAGFPTETDAMHANSLALVEECDIVMGHVFPYSAKAGTPAARMPQVPAAAIKERARRLRDACARRRQTWLEGLVGTTQRVLAERGGTGHAENFAPVRLLAREQADQNRSSRAKSRGAGTESEVRPSTSLGTNEVVSVLITSVEGDRLIGVAA